VSDAGWKFIGLLCEKNHVCPSGSLRVKYKNKEKGKKETERDGEIENEKGEEERKSVREKNKTNDQPSLVYFLQRTTVTNAFGTAPNMK